MPDELIVSDLTVQSYKAFLNDLANLLVSDPGKFVAYAGEKQLGIDSDAFALEKRIQLPPHQYEMYYIEPQELTIDLPTG